MSIVLESLIICFGFGWEQSGGLAASTIHVARTICRRAERRVVSLVEQGIASASCQKYLNRFVSHWESAFGSYIGLISHFVLDQVIGLFVHRGTVCFSQGREKGSDIRQAWRECLKQNDEGYPCKSNDS